MRLRRTSSTDCKTPRKHPFRSSISVNATMPSASSSTSNKMKQNIQQQPTSNKSFASSANVGKSVNTNILHSPSKNVANSHAKSCNSKLRDKLILNIGANRNNRGHASLLNEFPDKATASTTANAPQNLKMTEMGCNRSIPKISDTKTVIGQERKTLQTSIGHPSPNQPKLAPPSHPNILHPPPLTPAPPFANPAILNLLLRPPGPPPPPPPTFSQPPRLKPVPMQQGTTTFNQNLFSMLPPPTMVLPLPYFIPVPIPIPIPIPIPGKGGGNGTQSEKPSQIMESSPVPKNVKSPQASKSTTDSSSTNDTVMVKVEKDSDDSSQCTNDQPNQTRFVH